MDIRYVNKEGEQLFSEQIKTIKEYNKQYYSNNVLMYEESYYEGVLYGIDYYNREGREHRMILDEIMDEKYNEHNIIHQIFYPEGFRLETLFVYGDGKELLGKINTLYDVNNYGIGYEIFFDGIGLTTKPNYASTNKEYWDLDINPKERLFVCHFDSETGTVESIEFENNHIGWMGQDREFINPDVEEIMKRTKMSAELAYYYTIPDIIPKFRD